MSLVASVSDAVLSPFHDTVREAGWRFQVIYGAVPTAVLVSAGIIIYIYSISKCKSLTPGICAAWDDKLKFSWHAVTAIAATVICYSVAVLGFTFTDISFPTRWILLPLYALVCTHYVVQPRKSSRHQDSGVSSC